jgi:molybdate transport system substrate-binding protein
MPERAASRRRAVAGPGAAALALLLATACAAAATPPPGRAPATVTLYAAASLHDTVDAIADAFTARSGIAVKRQFAASSLLAMQIRHGAPADVFISADEAWMDALDSDQLLEPGTRKRLLSNRLVLIAPADSRLALHIEKGFALARALGGQHLAVADPASVPAGRYAEQALRFLGVYDSVEPALLRSANVRAALSFVARGETPLGIVYATDARVEPKVRVVDVFPDESCPAIAYAIGMMRGAGAGPRQLLDYLEGPEALALFERAGFLTPR